jgi:hypothetical protein
VAKAYLLPVQWQFSFAEFKVLFAAKAYSLYAIWCDFFTVPDTIYQGCGSGSRRANVTHKRIKKLKNFLFQVLDVLF